MENQLGALVQTRAQKIADDFVRLGESWTAVAPAAGNVMKHLEELRRAIFKEFGLDKAILGYIDEIGVSKEARYLKNFEPPVIKLGNVHQLTPDELKEALTCDIPENPTIANTDKAWSLYEGPFSKIKTRRFHITSRAARESSAKAAIQAEEDREIFRAINAILNDDEEPVGDAVIRGMMQEMCE